MNGWIRGLVRSAAEAAQGGLAWAGKVAAQVLDYVLPGVIGGTGTATPPPQPTPAPPPPPRVPPSPPPQPPRTQTPTPAVVGPGAATLPDPQLPDLLPPGTGRFEFDVVVIERIGEGQVSHTRVVFSTDVPLTAIQINQAALEAAADIAFGDYRRDIRQVGGQSSAYIPEIGQPLVIPIQQGN